MQAAHNVDDAIGARVMDIKVDCVMRGIRKVLPLFQEQGSGVIVNLASITGLQGGPAGLTYTAAKHTVAGMTKNVGCCNTIAPAQVDTAITQSIEGYDMFGLGQANMELNSPRCTA